MPVQRASAHLSYRLINRAVRPALAARHAGCITRRSISMPMREAARALIGEHDFSAFARRMSGQDLRFVPCMPSSSSNTPAHRFRDPRQPPSWQHMVRNIVGSLIYVGQR